MVSFNLVFHVASGLALVVLIYALLSLQSQMKFQRMLWQSLHQTQPRVLVDWPHIFLSRFARALDLSIQGEANKLAARKIRPETWVRAYMELGLVELIWKQNQSLSVRVRNEADYSAWAKSLEMSLGGQVQIDLEKTVSVSKGARN